MNWTVELINWMVTKIDQTVKLIFEKSASIYWTIHNIDLAQCVLITNYKQYSFTGQGYQSTEQYN